MLRVPPRGGAGGRCPERMNTTQRAHRAAIQPIPAILGSIMEHYMSGAPIMASAGNEEIDTQGEFYDEGDINIVNTIKELLESRVRPAVAQDGGDITFRGFRDGKVYLNMKGSCAGCPSSTATLRHGIENLLKHFCPDVQEVQPV